MLTDVIGRLRATVQMVALGLFVVVFGSLAAYLAVNAILWLIFTST